MLNQLIDRPELEAGGQIYKLNTQVEELIAETEKASVTEETKRVVNQEIKSLNSIADSGKVLKSQLKKALGKIVTILESENGLVTKNHYQKKGLALGISLGMLFGVVFGQVIGNMGYISIGLMFGLAIGVGLGRKKDLKAQKEGKQLNIELLY